MTQCECEKNETIQEEVDTINGENVREKNKLELDCRLRGQVNTVEKEKFIELRRAWVFNRLMLV